MYVKQGEKKMMTMYVSQKWARLSLKDRRETVPQEIGLHRCGRL